MRNRFLYFVCLVILGIGTSLVGYGQELTVVSFNVRSFEPDFDVAPYARLLKGEHPDVICLNEVENRSSRQMVNGAYRDVVQDLANQMGMFGYFGYSYSLSNKKGERPASDFRFEQNEMYGNAILSKYPILNVNAYQLPRPAGSADQRSVAVADILLPTKKIVRVAVVHLDHVGGRKEQAEVLLTNKVLDGKTPTLLMGDFNDFPGSEILNLLGSQYDRLDNDDVTYEYGSKLDYVLGSKGNWEKVSATVLPRYFEQKELSDHFPIKSVVRLK